MGKDESDVRMIQDGNFSLLTSRIRRGKKRGKEEERGFFLRGRKYGILCVVCNVYYT